MRDEAIEEVLDVVEPEGEHQKDEVEPVRIAVAQSREHVNSDLRTDKSTTGVEVHNYNPYPVVINEAGQTLGARQSCVVNLNDKVLQKLLAANKVSLYNPLPPAKPKPKKK